MNLPRFRKVGDASVRAHEDIGRVQVALQKPPLRLRQMNATERSLGKVVRRHENQAVDANLVDRVHRLQDATHPLEALLFGAVGTLLGYHADPLVTEDPDREDCYPAAVDELHGLDCQHGRDYVVRVVSSAADHHQTVS